MANIFGCFCSKSLECSSSSQTPKPQEISSADIQQYIDNWKIPKHPTKDIFRNSKRNLTSNYAVETIEQTIPLTTKDGKIKLLSPEAIEKLRQKYQYLHYGLVQAAVKPLTKEGSDISLLLCLRDSRFLNFNDSLLGVVETNLHRGPVYFDCFPNYTVSLQDRNFLELNFRTAGYETKTGSPSVALLYRIQYKATNSAFSSGALKTMTIGENAYFQSDLPRSHIFVPRSISWNQVTFPDHWMLPAAAAQNTVKPGIGQLPTE